MNNIPFKSKLVRFTNIENRNKAFHALSDEDKRKEIAFDALNLVIIKKLNASNGCYWDNNLENRTKLQNDSKELQIFLSNKLPKCEVCQRGALMISTIRLGNTVEPTDKARSFGEDDNIQGFNELSFSRLENEFENDYFNTPYPPNTNRKLANLCCNIIANGDFNSIDDTDYLKKWKIKIK